MASWAKNQITKQLAKFAKNLDPSSLSLKFLKGECELNNLELDEGVLSDLLEFPPWLQLTKVTCNKISAKVPWTTLKSDPIKLLLDCVEVEIVASETAREKSKNTPVFKEAKPGKYGFSEKVLDGMYVSINTLHASFISVGFKASANISRIIIQSTTPDWRVASNLRHTRIKDDWKGQVLTFKEIKWGTMRLDADASYKPESKEIPSTPLRLITNNSALRLIIKKSLNDCHMIASKLAVILDDILWVLTRSQLLKLSSFVHYIIKLRSKFIPLSHQLAPTAQKIDESANHQSSQQQNSHDQLFAAYDLHETSFHLRTHRIDLHLCDDNTLVGKQTLPEKHRRRFDESGAALQISVMNISLDHCPYHVAGTKRTVVKADEEVAYQRMKWAHQLINNFDETEGRHVRPSRRTSFSGSRSQRSKMYESFFIVSCRDFSIMQVTTAQSGDPKPFLSSEKQALFLPPEMSAIYIDHTTYYYPVGNDLPVPAPNVFVQANPIQLRFDPLTCVWLNRFAQSVITGLDWTKEFMSRELGFVEHVNVRVEALMPKVTIPMTKDESSKPHSDMRPTGMQIQISQAVVSNCRIGAKCCQADLLNDLQNFIGLRLYADMSRFPNEKQDLSPSPNASWLNDYSINHFQLHRVTQQDKNAYARMRSQGNLPHQIFCVWCDQLWVEFIGIEKAGKRPITFVDAFPLRVWISLDVPYYESVSHGNIASPQQDSVNSPSSHMSPEYERRFCSSDPLLARAYSSQSDHRIEAYPQSLYPHAENFDERGGAAYRMSHSESDIVHMDGNSSTIPSMNSSMSDLNSSYAQGGPPPPYSPDVVSVGIPSSSVSMSSLPPAYEVLESETTAYPEKQLPNDIIDYGDSVTAHAPGTSILLNVEKPVGVQIDHFQLLFLLRIAEAFSEMMECISFDIELCQKERTISLNQWSTVEQQSKNTDTSLVNIHVPEVIVNLILPPCIGIDPIQQLTVLERVQYDKECRDQALSSTEDLPLPLRKASIHSTTADEKFHEQSTITSVDSQSASPPLTGDNTVGSSGERPGQEFMDEQVEVERKDVELQCGESCLPNKNKSKRPEEEDISVLCIHGNTIIMAIETIQGNSVVKIAMQDMQVNELGNLKYGRVMDPRGCFTSNRNPEKTQVDMNSLTGDSVFKMRLVTGPAAEQFAEGAKDLGFADIRISSLCSALLMSTVDNLAEFAEDEYIFPMMPFVVDIANSDISLYDDKPRRYESAIKLPPMQVLLDGLTVNRDQGGTITLNKKPKTDEATAHSAIDYEDNRSLINTSQIAESINTQVECLIGENNRLLEDLKVVNAKVNGLHSERESLLKVIDKLQQELMYSNRENDDLHLKVRSLSLRKQQGHYV